MVEGYGGLEAAKRLAKVLREKEMLMQCLRTNCEGQAEQVSSSKM